MSRTQRALVLLVAAAAFALIGWRAIAWRTAAGEYERARAFHTDVTGKAARLAALRSQPPVSGFGARPGDDVIQLANHVLEAAGLPAARLRGVQPDADRVLPDDRDGRRAATVRLAVEPVTVQELGALLSAWRSSQQVWSVARIELNAMGRGPAGQYRASLIVSATYVDDSSSSTAPLLGAKP
jgi:hypothetical protein